METTKSRSIMAMIFEKTEFTDEDYVSIGEHFERLMPYDMYGRGDASQCLHCSHCKGDDYDGNWVYSCEREYDVDYNMKCVNGYCPYHEFGKDIVELLTSELNKTKES